MISREDERWLIKRLCPGEYEFQHDTLGDVSLTLVEDPESYLTHGIRIFGSKIVEDENGKEVRKPTIGLYSHGINFDQAFIGLDQEVRNVITDYSIQRELEENEIVYVKNGRPVMLWEEKRAMTATGRIPTRLRRIKTDSF